MKRIIIGAGLILFFSFQSGAQILKGIKNAAVDVGKNLNTKENRDKVGSIALKSLEKARSVFDSTDFDYAILLSDNSGLFDTKEEGELKAQATSLGGVVLEIRKNGLDASFTAAEKARMYREFGELSYAKEMFKMAEQSLIDAKAIYEKAGLAEEVGYMKTLADQ